MSQINRPFPGTDMRVLLFRGSQQQVEDAMQGIMDKRVHVHSLDVSADCLIVVHTQCSPALPQVWLLSDPCGSRKTRTHGDGSPNPNPGRFHADVLSLWRGFLLDISIAVHIVHKFAGSLIGKNGETISAVRVPTWHGNSLSICFCFS